MHVLLEGIALELQGTSWIKLCWVLLMKTCIAGENTGWKNFSHAKV